jgi:hypothetical protein
MAGQTMRTRGTRETKSAKKKEGTGEKVRCEHTACGRHRHSDSAWPIFWWDNISLHVNTNVLMPSKTHVATLAGTHCSSAVGGVGSSVREKEGTHYHLAPTSS